MATNCSIFLGLGSNIIPRKEHISKSLVAIKNEFPSNFRFSYLYLTDPFHSLHQPAYYNCCVGFDSSVAPEDLLSFCTSLEKELGRERSESRWASRVIDIDILLYGGKIIQKQNLIVPHYDLENRDFFLLPLIEIEPGLQLPGKHTKLSELLKKIPSELRTNPQKLLKFSI